MELSPIEFHPSAAKEVTAAQRWYANIRPDLGTAFAEEFQQGIARLASAPQRFAQHLHGTRAYVLNRFPYLIVYRLLGNNVQVVAVQHAKQRPGYWRSRTKR
jgi:plasmid stabilization system protein ParE